MQIADEICICLEEEKALFLEYESCTEALCTCALEDMSHYITQRDDLAIKIDKIEEEISALCEMDPQGELLREAAKNICDFESLPAAFFEVYRHGQAIFSIVNRILTMQDRIMLRIEQGKKDSLAEISQLKERGQVKNYLNNLVGQKASGAYMSDKKI